MTFYHGTSPENWKKIQKEGMLWGVRDAPSRVTWLANSPYESMKYGSILLKVEWTPSKNSNYIEGCWQFREYDPIPLENISIMAKEELI